MEGGGKETSNEPISGEKEEEFGENEAGEVGGTVGGRVVVVVFRPLSERADLSCAVGAADRSLRCRSMNRDCAMSKLVRLLAVRWVSA